MIRSILKCLTVVGGVVLLAASEGRAAPNRNPPGTVPPPRPDLVCRVTAFVGAPKGDEVSSGSTVYIPPNKTTKIYLNFHVKNVGPGDAPQANNLFNIEENGYTIQGWGASFQSKPLKTGKETTWVYATPLSSGRLRIPVKVDADKKIIEKNESNNECEFVLTVRTSPKPVKPKP